MEKERYTMEHNNCEKSERSPQDILRYAAAGILMLLLAVFVFGQISDIPQAEAGPFAGKGTRDMPYRIDSEADLALLAEKVNQGELFEGFYFLQTRDLDLAAYENWIPIGSYDSGNAFSGVYDGGGHVIKDLTIHGETFEIKNVGLFGRLGGTVCNLGIESGEITGGCVGSIASSSASIDALIVNCYSNATLTGSRCGGIADNFGVGKILCCWSGATLNGKQNGAIASYTANEIFGCSGTTELINANFTGTIEQSEIRSQPDPDVMAESLRAAKYRYDLQDLDIGKTILQAPAPTEE